MDNTEFYEFLRNSPNKLHQDVEIISQIYIRYACALSDMVFQHSKRKMDVKVLRDAIISDLRGKEDPATGKKYTEDGMKAVPNLDAEVQEMELEVLELERKVSNLKAAVKAIEIKNNNIPGLQGFVNRTTEMEND